MWNKHAAVFSRPAVCYSAVSDFSHTSSIVASSKATSWEIRPVQCHKGGSKQVKPGHVLVKLHTSILDYIWEYLHGNHCTERYNNCCGDSCKLQFQSIINYCAVFWCLVSLQIMTSNFTSWIIHVLELSC